MTLVFVGCVRSKRNGFFHHNKSNTPHKNTATSSTFTGMSPTTDHVARKHGYYSNPDNRSKFWKPGYWHKPRAFSSQSQERREWNQRQYRSSRPAWVSDIFLVHSCHGAEMGLTRYGCWLPHCRMIVTTTHCSLQHTVEEKALSHPSLHHPSKTANPNQMNSMLLLSRSGTGVDGKKCGTLMRKTLWFLVVPKLWPSTPLWPSAKKKTVAFALVKCGEFFGPITCRNWQFGRWCGTRGKITWLISRMGKRPSKTLELDQKAIDSFTSFKCSLIPKRNRNSIVVK